MLFTIATLIFTHTSVALLVTNGVTQELDEASREIRRLRDEKDAAEEELDDVDEELQELREKARNYGQLLKEDKEAKEVLVNWILGLFAYALALTVTAAAMFNYTRTMCN
jgi:Skp family chaperone for outer membrane proteins